MSVEIPHGASQGQTEPQEYVRPRLWKATELAPATQPRWLAKGRIPRGAISLLVGDEGIGKSLFWVLIAAAVTTGKPLPEFGIPAREPADVFVVITEDEWSPVVLPRLAVAGADIDRIHVICTDEDGSGSPTFPHDLDIIADADVTPALVVVDAWLDTVPSGLSVKDPQQARKALHPWKECASRTGSAILLLTHTNRVASGNARDKYGATGELRKKARMSLFAQLDAEDGCLLIGPEKANSAGKLPASRFRITPVAHFPATDDDNGTVPRLDIIGDSTHTMAEHIAESYENGSDDDAPERVGAAKWLREYLEMEGPRAVSAEVKRSAKAVGISERTLARARTELRVEIDYQGRPAVTVWSLPEQAVPPGARPSERGTAGTAGISPVQRDIEKMNRPAVPRAKERAQPGTAGLIGPC